MSGNLVFDVRPEGIAEITFSRPEKRNALNDAAMRELDAVLRECRANAAVRAVLLTGAGEKAFVAGADINEFAALGPLEAKARVERDQAVERQLETLGKPTLAAINGWALGGGLELALCCAMRVAAANARFGLPEVKIGMFPANGGTQRLPRLIGPGRALEMMLTGEPIGADEAHRIGLVNHVVEPERLLEFSRELLGRTLANAPVAMKQVLDCVDVGLRCGLEDGLRYEAAAFAAVAASADRLEGTRAFLEKRTPRFQGK